MVFALCGGDARQAELARLLLEDGHEVRSWALERAELPGGAKVCASAAEALEGADCLLLPMPVSAKSGLLNAPLSEGTHCLGEVFAAAEPGMPVCGGAIAPEARAVAEGRGLRLHDLGPAHLEAVGCYGGVERHILRLERRDAQAVLRENAAQPRADEALAGV